MTARLSPAMDKALTKARLLGDGQLERWPGGFWTYPGCPFEQGTGQSASYRIPAWYVSTQTVRALVARGMLRWSGEQGYDRRAEVTA